MTNDLAMSVYVRYFVYIIGFIFGIYLFEVLKDATSEPGPLSNPGLGLLLHNASYQTKYKTYDSWLKIKGFVLSKVDQDELSFGKNGSELRKTLESNLLYNLIHVTCVVFINKAANAYMVANTWGRHCNSLLFYSSNNTKLDYIDMHIIPIKNSWQYLCECIRHLWLTKKHLEWVVFSFDDIYVIPENLRYFLALKNYSESHYFGHNVHFWNVLYNSGQTSFVLSKGSIDAIVSKFNHVSSCQNSGRYMNNGDYYLGKYLAELNITAGNARDFKGRERFHILKLEILLTSGSESIVEKYTKKSVWPIKVGLECCSDTTISFPTNGANLLVHFLNYQAKVFHSGKLGNRLKNETDDPEAWKEFAREEFGNEIDVNEITDLKYFQMWEEKDKELEKRKHFL